MISGLVVCIPSLRASWRSNFIPLEGVAYTLLMLQKIGQYTLIFAFKR